MYLYFVLPLGSCAPASFASAFAILFFVHPPSSVVLEEFETRPASPLVRIRTGCDSPVARVESEVLPARYSTRDRANPGVPVRQSL